MAAIYDFDANLKSVRLCGTLQQWKSLTGTALKSPKTCPFLIFMDQAELKEEQLPARSRTGNIKSVFTDVCRLLAPKFDVFVLAC